MLVRTISFRVAFAYHFVKNRLEERHFSIRKTTSNAGAACQDASHRHVHSTDLYHHTGPGRHTSLLCILCGRSCDTSHFTQHVEGMLDRISGDFCIAHSASTFLSMLRVDRHKFDYLASLFEDAQTQRSQRSAALPQLVEQCTMRQYCSEAF